MAQNPGWKPPISIVIPVLGEEENIARLIAHLRHIDRGENCEIIVVDGDIKGSTLAAIDDPRVVTMTSPRGRSRQMNAGAARARAECILFLHADTFLPADAISLIAETMRDRRFVGGAFRLEFTSDRWHYRVMSWVVTARARLFCRPFGDQGIFCDTAYFHSIGGFADIELMEDVEFSRRVHRLGQRLRILPASVRTSPRRLEAEGVLRRAATNWMLLVLYGVGVDPNKLTRWYRYSAPSEPAAAQSEARRYVD